MKILIAGSEKQWAIENFYIKYLTDLGAEVVSFPAHDLFDDYYHSSIVKKLMVRAHLSGIYQQINQQLIEQAQKNNVDVIWIFKGMEIFPKTLASLKLKGIKLVNYNPDHPFIHTSRGSGNKLVTQSVGLYDAHFCYSLPVIEKIQNEYHIPCRWLPFAFEPAEFEFPSANTEIIKACFIGNPDQFRAATIKKLTDENIKVDVYGNNWNKFLNESDSLNIFPAIYKSDFNQIAPRYRLHLNIFRPHNDNSHNMRTFEMPGLGCIVLAPDSREHRKLYKNNEEIFLYSTDDELISKARNILNLKFEKAMEFRKAANQRVINDGYTYKDRSKEVLDWMQELLTKGSLNHYN